MASLKDYFEKRDANLPKPKWVSGDRIFGRIGKIPVLGSVVREDYNDPNMVLCMLDLPVSIEGTVKSVVLVPSKSMKRLVVL